MADYSAPRGEDQTNIKLTEEEQRLVARLFSDPTYFPVEFRTWLKSYLEGSGLQIHSSQIVQGGPTTQSKLPPGIIIPVAAQTLPTDCLPCDGAAILRTTYKKLFDVIGVVWGPGDNTTTFNVPDLRDRALYSAGSA